MIISLIISAFFFIFNIHCGLFPISGNGIPATSAYEFQDFSSLTLGNGCEATIERADSFSIEVTIDENLEDYLQVTKKGQNLNIDLLSGKVYRSFAFRAKITTPSVDDISGSGGSHILLPQFFDVDGNLYVTLSGGSSLDAAFRAPNVEAVLSGGSELELEGRVTDHLLLTTNGGSSAHLTNFECNDVTVLMSGGSSADINASGTITGNLSGGSVLEYQGRASCQQLTNSGGSSVSKID